MPRRSNVRKELGFALGMAFGRDLGRSPNRGPSPMALHSSPAGRSPASHPTAKPLRLFLKLVQALAC